MPSGHLSVLFGRNLDISSEELAQLEQDKALDLLYEYSKNNDILPPETGREQFQCLFNVFRGNFDAEWYYQHPAYSGPITIILAKDQNREGLPDPSLVWEPLLHGPVETLETPGTHLSIVVEPDVADLAALISGCLEKKPNDPSQMETI